MHRAGARAWLAEYAGTPDVLAAARALRKAPPRGMVDLVPAERTLLLSAADPLDMPGLRRRLESLRPAPDAQAAPAAEVEIPVVYDGEDLADLAAQLGMTSEALVAAHGAETWTAAFGGFAPGFAYLLPEGEGLGEVPRRAEPRPRVPAGSVALAARYSGVYPRSSPGGWQLIGRTEARLWAPEREDSPALLSPGTSVRFRAVRAGARLSARRAAGEAGRPAASRSDPRTGARASSSGRPAADVLGVLSPGPLLLVEDAGRPGYADLGVGRSGAADHGALVRANVAVGNPPSASALELLLGPASFVAQRAVVLSVAGAPAELTVHRAGSEAGADADGQVPALRVPRGRAVALDAGDRLDIGAVRRGLRVVIAVRGGVEAGEGPVLGSWARDTLSGLGPAPLAAGDRIGAGPTIGLDAVPAPPLDAEAEDDAEADPQSIGPGADAGPDDHADADADADADAIVLPVALGPRAELLGAEAVAALTGRTWHVRPDSDRVGVRLDGMPLPVPSGAGTLPSEAIVPGSVQVPPSGLPVVFGRDHPATGGYPVVGVVAESGLDLLAQAPPGTAVRFRALPEA
ncbi:carboxyltransferase domain-containing protein [Brachybacterium phenoliresistens]|uniref:5-oxoprolinase subunit B/C family protein n=1 Tax=Brachybacterium phenoliresistens TaxID=396014 RepID=UPI0004B76797|nr:carboxyltransferase domain-containing protein [Brachybacterium phenoliresistens]